METGRANTYRAVRELADEGLLVSRQRLGTYVAPTTGEKGSLAGRVIVMPMVQSSKGKAFDPFLAEAAEALKYAFAEMGATLEPYPTVAGVHGKIVLPEHADAAVIFNLNSTQYIEKQEHQALVVINTAEETIVDSQSGYDVLTLHQEQGGLLAGRHLKAIGCKRACFLGCYSPRFGCWGRTPMARLEGFERGWGGELPAEYMIRCVDYSEAAGAMAVSDYLALDPRPDAVFAVSDEIAVGFITGALAHGLVVGRDYKIIGFDGQPRGRQVHGGPLTTLDAPMEDISSSAAQLIAARLAEPERPLQRRAFACNLFAGNTA